MHAGDLRDRVGFYKRAVTSDSYGNTQGDFAADPEFVVFANIRPRLGGEDVLSARLQGTHLVNITVRVSAQVLQVTPEWRAKNELTGEVFNIRSIIDPEQATPKHGLWIEMLCEKGVAT